MDGVIAKSPLMPTTSTGKWAIKIDQPKRRTNQKWKPTLLAMRVEMRFRPVAKETEQSQSRCATGTVACNDQIDCIRQRIIVVKFGVLRLSQTFFDKVLVVHQQVTCYRVHGILLVTPNREWCGGEFSGSEVEAHETTPFAIFDAFVPAISFAGTMVDRGSEFIIMPFNKHVRKCNATSIELYRRMANVPI